MFILVHVYQVASCTAIDPGLQSQSVRSIGHQDSEIDAREPIVYQHQLTDQEVVLAMVF